MSINGVSSNNFTAPYSKTAQPINTTISGQTADEPAPVKNTVEAERISREEAAVNKLNEMSDRYRQMAEQMESVRAQGEAAAEIAKKRMKCLIIAMRIMSGDKVPKEDYVYLAENDPELYGKALMLRKQKDDPREYDRISEDEENSGSGESPEIEIRVESGESVSAEDIETE